MQAWQRERRAFERLGRVQQRRLAGRFVAVHRGRIVDSDVDHQRLFERVSVFAAGWTLEAAEEICGDDAEGAAEVLDRLGRLVDHSMVMVQSSSGPVRFRLLEPLRPHPEAERILASLDVSSWAAAADGSGPLVEAERAAAEGRYADALEGFLSEIRAGDEREAAREAMLKLFWRRRMKRVSRPSPILITSSSMAMTT